MIGEKINSTLKPAFFLLLVFIVVLSLGGVMYSFEKKERTENEALLAKSITPTVLPIPMVTIEIEVPDGQKAFRDDQYRVFFTYPNSWYQSSNELIFPQGDLFKMSFYGGATFAVGYPGVTDKTPEMFAREVHGLKSEVTGKSIDYKEMTLGKYTYEKVSTCSDKCLTYYYTYYNGNVYSFNLTSSKTNNKEAEKTIESVFENLILF